jgi:hypothetical protein
MNSMGVVAAVMIVVVSAATIVGCRLTIAKNLKKEEGQLDDGERVANRATSHQPGSTKGERS